MYKMGQDNQIKDISLGNTRDHYARVISYDISHFTASRYAHKRRKFIVVRQRV